MTDGGSAQDDKIGYKRPPIHSRFPKGQSGNPSRAGREEFPGKSGKRGDRLSGLMVGGTEPMS